MVTLGDFSIITRFLVEIFFENLEEIKSALDRKEFVEDKGGGDITYRFDLEIEKLFYNRLKNKFGDILILGEEARYGSSIGQEFILIDPVDGSTNAKKGLPIFGTLLAYFESPSLESLKSAVVWDIPRDRVFFAERGKGAYLYDGEDILRLTIHENSSLEGEMLYDITPHSPLEAILRVSKYGKYRHLGSLGMSICYVCEGGLDLSIDLSGRGRMVDTLSPLLILEECGGYYILEPREPIDPSTKVYYIAGRNRRVVEEIYGEIWSLRGG